ncbi:hypothetical protein J6590_099628, partial [Homalodisca vitripennis]
PQTLRTIHICWTYESLTTGFSHYEVQGEAPSDKLYTSATLRPQLLGVISPPLRVLHIVK